MLPGVWSLAETLEAATADITLAAAPPAADSGQQQQKQQPPQTLQELTVGLSGPVTALFTGNASISATVMAAIAQTGAPVDCGRLPTWRQRGGDVVAAGTSRASSGPAVVVLSCVGLSRSSPGGEIQVTQLKTALVISGTGVQVRGIELFGCSATAVRVSGTAAFFQVRRATTRPWCSPARLFRLPLLTHRRAATLGLLFESHAGAGHVCAAPAIGDVKQRGECFA